MIVNRLHIDHLRNLDNVSLEDLADVNFFVGDNGAGKTSLLEALSIVSQGRSFRSNKITTVINTNIDSLSVFIECTDEAGVNHKLGIKRDKKNDYLVRINGVTAKTLAELSQILPVVVLDASSFDLLDGSASGRRKFVDWGVFHVEHQFYETWKQFNKILKQRNALLRSNQSDYSYYEPWDMELCKLSIQLEEQRIRFLKSFQPVFDDSLAELDDNLSSNKVFYKNGWGLDKVDFDALQDYALQHDAATLGGILKSSFQRDLKYQRTHLGPQKADIQIRVGRNDVKDIYSRGQKKSIVAALKLAQATVVKKFKGKTPVLLLDDLPSELDDQHLERFINYISRHGYQSFITSVDKRLYDENPELKSRMFHVERGKITAVNQR